MTRKEERQPKGLTEAEISLVLKARAAGESIKKIAKKIHVSDKRVASFLRPIEEKKRRHKINKGLFDKFVRLSCANANKTTRDFVATLNDHLLSQIEDVLKSGNKKDAKKKLRKSLDEIWVKFLDASMQMAIITMWTMPAKYKKLWMYMVCEDPQKSISK